MISTSLLHPDLASAFDEGYPKSEQIQHCATKLLLNDYTSNYKTCLVQLKILPLMYLLELQDVLFAIKSIKVPTKQFNIYDYINFNSATTRSGTSNKMIIPRHINNISRHSYFHRLPALWNALPIINLNLSLICAAKIKTESFPL